MPRNPNKLPCQVPGCRSWAMRGHTRCRAHRDAELGPRGCGAPRGNLNALRTGRHAHPLPPSNLAHLVQQLISDPQQLPQHLQPAIASVHARTRDPFRTLLALQAALDQLLPLLAQILFAAELEDLLRRLPAHQRSALASIIQKHVLPHHPQRGLRLLRGLAARLDGHLLPVNQSSTSPPASLRQGPTTGP